MAYAPQNLKIEFGERGTSTPRQWFYKSTDAVTTVRGADYFTDAFQRGMRRHDMVRVVQVNGSDVPQTATLCYVLTVDEDGADLSDGTAITLTNT